MIDYDELTQSLIEAAQTEDDGYFQYAYIVARRLPKHLHEQLNQLVNGPVWDGDIICKSYRDRLFWFGLAVRVCCKGEQGFTGANYFAFSVNEAINQIKAGKIG